MNTSIRAVLLLLACLSPLLTLASLWQLKEWRIDRLKEHLRREGWLRQLFGMTRPMIVLLGIILIVLLPNFEGVVIDATLLILAASSIGQLTLGKQRQPVWTMKAMILVIEAMGITLIVSIPSLVLHHQSLMELPLLQPFALFAAWSTFYPLDCTMKKKIMKQAEDLLASYTKATVIGITGSVGKTTTKELITHVLADKKILSTPAYVNSDMGVSQWLLRELPKHSRDEELIVIVEMGAYREGEIALLCKICKPTIGIITYIGTQHLALFGSQEKLANAKSELIASLPKDGRAFLNADCDLCLTIQDRAQCPVTTVGTAGSVDLEAKEIEEHSDGIHFRVGDVPCVNPIHGTHNVTNVLLMMGVCEMLGLDMKDISARTRSFSPPHHTFDVRKERDVTILDDTHNASPESFRAAIAWAKTNPSSPKVLITPGLIELGPRSAKIHRDLGGQASGIFDRVIFTGKNGYHAFSEGFGSKVERYANPIQTVTPGSLLACIGRVSAPKIRNLLP